MGQARQQRAELALAGRNQNQALGKRSVLEPEQTCHCGFIAGIATESPHGLGGTGDDTSAMQGVNRRLEA
jgi:hypothetical protein